MFKMIFIYFTPGLGAVQFIHCLEQLVGAHLPLRQTFFVTWAIKHTSKPGGLNYTYSDLIMWNWSYIMSTHHDNSRCAHRPLCWVHQVNRSRIIMPNELTVIRAPLTCVGTGDLHRGRAEDSSVATVWCYHVSMDWRPGKWSVWK